jgi:hypothetical protein
MVLALSVEHDVQITGLVEAVASSQQAFDSVADGLVEVELLLGH